MTRPLYAALLLLSTGLAAGSALGATVEVTFVEQDKFSDAGFAQHEREANLKVLAAHLQQLGQRSLLAGQTLKVTVTDVDLAGRVVPGSVRDLRVLNGGADWPRIELRYTLQAGSQTLTSGEERVSDMNYLMHASYPRVGEPLAHEKRMLDTWFAARFPAVASPY
jgi:hypothetical protein